MPIYVIIIRFYIYLTLYRCIDSKFAALDSFLARVRAGMILLTPDAPERSEK